MVAEFKTKLTLRRSEVESLLACTEWENDRSENAAFGNVFHDFAARYLLACQEANGVQPELVNDLTREVFFAEPQGLNPGRLEEMRELTTKFANSLTSDDWRALLAVEYELSADAGFVLLTGTPDRINLLTGTAEHPESILIYDYKSQLGADPGEHQFQMRFYAKLAFETWPSLTSVATQVNYVRLGYSSSLTLYDRSTLDVWWDDMLFGLQKALAKPKGNPTGGSACQYCRKRMTCGAAVAPWRSVPENADQAEEVFMDWLRMEQAANETGEALKAFFKDRGPEVWRGQEVGWLTPREPQWKSDSPATVMAFLDAQGLDGAAAVKVDATKLPEYLKKQLVDSGLAQYEFGKPAFKHRKAPK